MARTRQTARKGICGKAPRAQHYTPHTCSKFRELMIKNDQSQHTDIISRLAPYSRCAKLARFWILKDLQQQTHDDDAQQQENVLQLLQSLPLDVKIDIITFIPTTSLLVPPYVRHTQTGAKLKEQVDPWWFSLMKHRLISTSFKSVLENIICKRLSREGLDASDSVLVRPSALKRHPIWKLLEIQERFMTLQANPPHNEKLQSQADEALATVPEGSNVLVEGECVWNAMLHFTGSPAKFYTIQLMVDGKNYCVFTRWGLFGQTGQKKIIIFTSLMEAKAEFRNKFKDRTGNDWENRSNFQLVVGKYNLVDMSNTSISTVESNTETFNFDNSLFPPVTTFGTVLPPLHTFSTTSSNSTEQQQEEEDTLMSEMMQRDLKDLEDELIEDVKHLPHFNLITSFLDEGYSVDADIMKPIQECKSMIQQAFSEYNSRTNTLHLPQVTNQYLKSLTVSIASEHDCYMCMELLHSLQNLEHVTLILYSYSIFYSFANLIQVGMEYPCMKHVKFICLSSNTGFGFPDIMMLLTTLFPDISKIECEGFMCNEISANIQSSIAQYQEIEIVYKNMNADLFEQVCSTYNIYPFVSSPDVYTSVVVDEDVPIIEKKKIIEYLVPHFDMKDHHWVNSHYQFQNPQLAPLYQYTIYLMNKHGQHFGSHSDLSFSTISMQYGYDICSNMLESIPYFSSSLSQDLMNMFEEKLKKKEAKLSLNDFLGTLLHSTDYGTMLQVFTRFKNYLPEEDAKKLFKRFVLYKNHDLHVNLFNYLLHFQAPRHVLDYILDFMTPEDLLETTVMYSEQPEPGHYTVNTLLTAILSSYVSDQFILKIIEKQPLLVNMSTGLEITPLHAVCADTSRWGLIPYLVEQYHADVFAKDKKGRTPYQYALYQCPYRDAIPACLRMSGQEMDTNNGL
ncbi:hypothetical protein C9374_007677 [Naegleria lovaniensis]|uniref:NAD(+) ADP-ribosyltransferase n=1 Tax=Naegleria lovaniensis TaxID=51637 RepID=A0AA88GK71_NAELO|nr:uncharacterized protein C9374_007677 [Naegleria lovaniensis]KAG2379039.1 hypothetical protein C9374_007677 [Naegleria lovaniensis]